MRIEYKDGAEAGHGFIVFSEAMIPEGPWEISIQRSSDQKFLSGKKANQWSGEHIFFPLAGHGAQDGSLELEVGPKVVDSLDQQEQYRVNLKGGLGNHIPGRLKIGQITYTAGKSLDNTASLEEREQPEAPQQAPERLEMQPLPNREPPVEEPAQDEEQQPASEKKKSRLWPVLIILLLICAAIAGYFLFKKSGDETPVAQKQESPKKEEPKQEAPKSATQSIPAQVNEFFAAPNPESAGAMALASKLKANTSEDQDAVYRLYNFAGEKGDQTALLPYGEYFDPSTPQKGSIRKDASIAWEIYSRAKNSNVEGAQAAQDKLLNWLREQAEKGNSKAKTWLGQIKR